MKEEPNVKAKIKQSVSVDCYLRQKSIKTFE